MRTLFSSYALCWARSNGHGEKQSMAREGAGPGLGSAGRRVALGISLQFESKVMKREREIERSVTLERL